MVQSLPAGTRPSPFKLRLCSWLNPAFLIPRKVRSNGKCLGYPSALCLKLELTCGNCFSQEPHDDGRSERQDPTGCVSVCVKASV